MDLGEIRMNYATAGAPERPALLLVPAQTESWWGYESVMSVLAEHFQVFAIATVGQPADLAGSAPVEPPQNMKEYDPEWARAFWVQDPELFTRLLLDWSRTLVPTNSPRA